MTRKLLQRGISWAGFERLPKIMPPPPPVLLQKDSYESVLNGALDSVSPGHLKAHLLNELGLKRIINKDLRNIIMKLAKNFDLSKLEKHPFLGTAGSVFGEEKGDYITPGVLILLLNQALSTRAEGISKSQLHLAKGLIETTAGYQIHRTIQEDTSEHMHHQGNKLATLTGDMLVVSLIKNISLMGNNKVLELIMKSLEDFSLSEITSKRPFILQSGGYFQSEQPQSLAESSLFSQGFQSSLILMGISDRAKIEWAKQFGFYVGLLWKTHFDYRQLTSKGFILSNPKQFENYLGKLSHNCEELGKGMVGFQKFIQQWGLK